MTGLSAEQSEEMPADGRVWALQGSSAPRAASVAQVTGFLTEQSLTVVARPKRVTSDSIKFKGQG